MMIAAFSRAIASTVEPSRSVWSSDTFVTTATPPSQAWVASSRPPRPTSTTATSTPASANQRNVIARQQFELRRLAVAPGDAIGQRQHLAGDAGEGLRINRHAIDLESLAIRDQVRLGSRAGPVSAGLQRRADERQDTALAVGAPDQCSAKGPLRMAESCQQGARTRKPQVNPESAARFKGGKGLRVAEGRASAGDALRQSFVSSSS